MINRRWVLTSYAQGAPDESLWTLEDAAIPAIAPGEVLVRTLWLSMDPYLRARLNPGRGLPLGEVMSSSGIGEVVESRHADWAAGDLISVPDLGWQEFASVDPDAPGIVTCERIHHDDPEPQAALSWLGMVGFTAYFAMTKVARPAPGDTVVVSAAGGGVGQIAGQIAHLAGARVIGIAGSDEKLAHCRSIGFDEGINYRASEDLSAEIGAACPQGVDVFFDGTGGAVHDAVLTRLAPRARVAIVGRIAVAGSGAADVGTRASSRLIDTRATIQGFTVYDWWHRRQEAVTRLRQWREGRQLHVREDVMDGIASAPVAFVRMMRGENIGKQLVAVHRRVEKAA
ncbi:NADP-dependent oxidoreductase [Microbacterium sp. X-17]|uniref:NADP-dependent oxidoreductase n=1 Tax=Microbacterium sp. X-17 TaxID=3144404 RepID=UPI0031F480A0